MIQSNSLQLGKISGLQKNYHTKSFPYKNVEPQIQINRTYNPSLKFINSELLVNKINNLENYIKFMDTFEVKSFLKENLFLIDIINKSVYIIKKIFKDIKLEISLEYDPEILTDSRFLYLKIYTKETPTKAIKLLKKFDYSWWLDIKPKTKHKLIIGVEYEDF